MPTTLAVPARPRAGAGLVVPAAVSTAAAPLLRRPGRGRVLACFPAAVYVRLACGEVVAVVTHDGLRLPNALVIASSSRSSPFARSAAGGGAAVDDGDLLVDGVRYRPVRAWAPRERTAGSLRADAVHDLRRLLGPGPHRGEVAARLAAGTAALAVALRTGDGLPDAAAGLVGLGPGLTPAGDDVLAGALVTCAQLARPAPELAAAVAERDGATTALSADLLRHAGAGRAAPPVLGLLDALVGAAPVAPALARLLAVGSTSGHDTATGVLLAASVQLDRREAA